MRPTSLFYLAALACLGLALSGCAKEIYVTVTINESGQVQLAQTMVFNRNLVEQSMKNRDQSIDEPNQDEVAAPPASATAPQSNQAAETKPEQVQAAKDAALASKLKVYIENQNFVGLGTEIKVRAVEVRKETVTIKLVANFDNLKDFAAGQKFSGLNELFNRLQIEKDADGKLRLTLSSPSLSAEDQIMNVARIRQLAGAAGFKGGLVFVMPGNIITSTLSGTVSNLTSLSVDAARAESLDDLNKVVTGGVIIVAEPGKLVLDALPLDSIKLAASAESDSSGYGQLPLVDAGPGCIVEALGVTTVTTHLFPEAQDILKDKAWNFTNGEKPGCKIEACVTVPSGQCILGGRDLKIFKAVDDQGRELKEQTSETGGIYNIQTENGETRKANFTIQLAAPPAGARAIETVSGELLLTTCAGWKEQELIDPQADAQKSISLSNVLSGASAVVTKVKAGKPQQDNLSGSITLKITGPAEIAQMDFQIKIEGQEQTNTYVNSSAMKSVHGQKVRVLTVQYNAFGRVVENAAAPRITLIPRYPADLKQKRIKFEFKEIDLF